MLLQLFNYFNIVMIFIGFWSYFYFVLIRWSCIFSVHKICTYLFMIYIHLLCWILNNLRKKIIIIVKKKKKTCFAIICLAINIWQKLCIKIIFLIINKDNFLHSLDFSSHQQLHSCCFFNEFNKWNEYIKAFLRIYQYLYSNILYSKSCSKEAFLATTFRQFQRVCYLLCLYVVKISFSLIWS